MTIRRTARMWCMTLLVTAGCACDDGAVEPDPVEAHAERTVVFGRIHTVDAARPWADAMVYAGERILYVGDVAGADALTGSETTVLDMGERIIVPGLHDVHQHTLEAHLPIIDCVLDPDVADLEDYIGPISACDVAADTGWILGAGHSVLTLLDAERSPRAILDDATGDIPTVILEATSHSSWVNSAALALLGIDGETADPPGGLIVRGPDGEPNGLLVDAAGEYPWDAALAPTEALRAINHAALLDGMAHANSWGITSAVDARTYWQRGYLDAYRAAEAADEMTLRMVLSLWASPVAEDEAQIAALAGQFSDAGGRVRIRQVKLYHDGLLENTTAALLAPYTTETLGPPSGLEYFGRARLARYTQALQAAGFDMHVHAIGDRAIREALDAIEDTAGAPGGASARHRLTHVEMVHPDDIARFAALGVAGDMQPGSHSEDAHLADLHEYVGSTRAGERMWRLRDLQEAGARLALSSDYDVGPMSPFATMARALSLGDRSAADVATAVRMYTLDAAWIMASERDTGSLEVGKYADFAVLDRDIFTATPADLAGAQVLMTVVGGEAVHRAPGI